MKNTGLNPREQQVEVLEILEKEWDNYKYFIIDAPTGVGKSYIAFAIAAALRQSYLLTSTIQLQDQYESTSKSFVPIKGRSNYICGINKDFTADIAPCIAISQVAAECKRIGICPYYIQKAHALEAQITVANYAYFMAGIASELNGEEDKEGGWQTRDSIICDEAHNLEQALISSAETILNIADIHEKHGIGHSSWKVTDDHEMNLAILESIHDQCAIKLTYYKQKMEEEFPNMDNYKSSRALVENMKKAKAEKLQRLQSKIRSITAIIEPLNLYFDTHETIDWLLYPNVEKNELTLTPLRANFLFKEMFANLADKIILMSATIGDPDVYCDELGIDKSEVKIIKVGTSFPKENSPIIIIPKLKMGAKDLEKSFGPMTDLIESILEQHGNEAGIIHSGTYRIQKELLARLNYKYKERIIARDMYGGRASDINMKNRDMIQLHESGQVANPVLMSPSLYEGTDLHDDLSRFQVILKMPWASLGDPRVHAKSVISKDWYANKMWTTILQASGRSVRHEEDFAVTYVLDASFKYFFSEWKHKLPGWFRERIIVD